MTDPDLADATYIEPDHAGMVAEIIEKERRAPRRQAGAAADHGRADGAQHRPDAQQDGGAGQIRRGDDRRPRRRPSTWPRTASCSARPWDASASKRRRRLRQHLRAEAALRRRAGRPRRRHRGSLSRSHARAEALADFAREWSAGERIRREEHRLTAQLQALEASKETRPSRHRAPLVHARRHRRRHRLYAGGTLRPGAAAASMPRPPARCWSSNRCSAGRNSRWRWCATRTTTASSSAPSRTSIPMGVHTGNSITVAPALTLTDKEYQRMRNASIAVLREIGVETGGSNVQFAVNPADGRMVVIEMNPRVSRSSALASKATGFPIAKVAARLAVGYTLDELANDITGGATPASFEPTIDYVVTKIPRFAFEKFPGAEPVLTTSMKSVGEVMAIGRTFAESLQKALRGLETGLTGLQSGRHRGSGPGRRQERHPRRSGPPDARPHPQGCPGDAPRHQPRAGARKLQVRSLVHRPDRRHRRKLRQDRTPRPAARCRQSARAQGHGLFRRAPRRARRQDRERGAPPAPPPRRAPGVQAHRHLRRPSSLRPPPTCTRPTSSGIGWAPGNEARPSERRKVVILGGGPNRIGQGIEFDYCCCHAAFALAEAGFETIMVNCNPETVSTDYDTSDRLYFEPLTAEDVLEILAGEKAAGTLVGVIVQYRRPDAAQARPRPGEGRHPDPRHLARRHRPGRGPRALPEACSQRSTSRSPTNGIARSAGEAPSASPSEIGYPVRDPPVLRAGRARHGDRPRRARACERYIDERGARCSGKQPGADRLLSVGRHRGRRRRAVADGQRRLRRRHHGAYRGGRHPFGRFGLLAAALFAQARR